MSREYRLVRSSRKTVAIYVRADGTVEVRAPYRAGADFIDSFVKQKRDWILRSQENMAKRREARRTVTLSPGEVEAAKAEAKALLTRRCEYYAGQMSVDYASVKVNSATTRWGSCSAKGSLNFTYRLIFAAPELIDYIVVHELAHRKEMNHSAAFWAVVEEVLPDYRKRREELKRFQQQMVITEGE